MTEEQADIFFEATLDKFMPTELADFIIGFFWAAVLLWMAWMCVHLVVGFWKGNLKFYDLGRYFIRASFLILLIAIIVR